MKTKTILSKFLALVVVFTMTFNMVLAETLETEIKLDTENISTEEKISDEIKTEEPTEEVKTEESSKEQEEVLTEEQILDTESDVEETPVEVSQKTAVVPEGNASITICKAIAQKVGDNISIVTGDQIPSGYTFTIPWLEAPATPGTEGFNVQPTISPDAIFSTDDFTPEKAFFGEALDSDCVKFSNLPYGSYFYGEEEISGGDDSLTWTTKYSDQILVAVNSFDDVYEYNDNIFTVGLDLALDPKGSIDANGNTFNNNSDGHIVLNKSNSGKNRTIVVLNVFEENQRYCNVQENLIQNGGFEYPDVTNGSGWQLYDNGTSGLGWEVEWRDAFVGAPAVAKLELHGGVNGWLPYEGSQYAELDTDWGYNNNEQASVTISQDIATIPGQYYELSYAFSPRPGTYEDDNVIRVRINGNNVDTQGLVAGGANTSWQKYTVGFFADSNTTTITFEDAGNANTLGTFLDDVRVVCADEPTDEEPPVEEEDRITFCHVPNGNGQNPQTQTLPETAAYNGHLNNHEDDYLGPCEEDEDQNTQGNSSSGSSSRGSVLGASTEGEVLGACVGFTKYHKKGDVGGEVAKIQEFLNEHMNAGLTVDGVYGETTVKAVHNFQKKYFDQIIKPWVPSFLARTTGKWYKTTRMMANELIVCPEEPVFLEDPKIMYKVDWTTEVKEN